MSGQARYDVIIRIPLTDEGAPMRPRPIVKHRSKGGHIRRIYNGKHCDSYEQAMLQAHNAYEADIANRTGKEAVK